MSDLHPQYSYCFRLSTLSYLSIYQVHINNNICNYFLPFPPSLLHILFSVDLLSGLCPNFRFL